MSASSAVWSFFRWIFSFFVHKVEAVDPVFQTKMLEMLKQTGRPEMVVGAYLVSKCILCINNTQVGIILTQDLDVGCLVN